MIKPIYIFIILCTGIISNSFAQDNKENFDDFFFKFASDSTFQKSRIKFPLEFKTWKNPEIVGGEMEIRKIKKEEWEHDYFFINENYRPQFYDNFEGELRDTDERLFQWIGIETRTSVKYFFKRLQGEWYLIKKENLGD